MIVVHHLNESRSHRILWLLEELGLPYVVECYQRDGETRLAPASLKAVHPLGKSPIVTIGAQVVAESGAIVDYLIRRHGSGRLQPDPSSAERAAYPNLDAWVRRFQSRPAYQAAIERGGPYSLAG